MWQFAVRWPAETVKTIKAHYLKVFTFAGPPGCFATPLQVLGPLAWQTSTWQRTCKSGSIFLWPGREFLTRMCERTLQERLITFICKHNASHVALVWSETKCGMDLMWILGKEKLYSKDVLVTITFCGRVALYRFIFTVATATAKFWQPA